MGFWAVFLVYTTLVNEGDTLLITSGTSANNAVLHPTTLEPLRTILQKPCESHAHQPTLLLIST